MGNNFVEPHMDFIKTQAITRYKSKPQSPFQVTEVKIGQPISDTYSTTTYY